MVLVDGEGKYLYHKIVQTIAHPFHHFRKYGPKHASLYLVSIMLLFWSVADGMVSYGSPLVITQAGISKTMMGFIVGTSSFVGAIFDFILSKYLKNTHFRRMFLLMFVFSAIEPFILWQASAVFLFVAAMGMWGIYYDLMNFGSFDFVGRKVDEQDHCSAFGVISVFRSIGYLLAPLLAGLVIGEAVDWRFFALMAIFFGIAFIYFIVLFLTSKKGKNEIIKEDVHKPLKFVKEIHLWGKVGKIIFPMLVFSVLLSMIDSFFWTIGPLIAESETVIKPFGGVLLTIYTIPSLFVGWFIGPVTKKFGKKRSGMTALFVSCLVLILFAFGTNPFLLVLVIFLSSFLLAFSWPAMRGTYADYIAESPQLEKEITALEDFAGNIGYVIGPISAGIMADLVGNTSSFAYLGIFAAVVTVILLSVTPRSIEVKVPSKDLK